MNKDILISGEKIEELQSLASQNLFMHAQQINDWAGDLRIFVKGMDLQVMSLPWEPNYSLDDDLWILPHWILVYSGLSLPFGQVIMRFLKIFSNSNDSPNNQTL